MYSQLVIQDLARFFFAALFAFFAFFGAFLAVEADLS